MCASNIKDFSLFLFFMYYLLLAHSQLFNNLFKEASNELSRHKA